MSTRVGAAEPLRASVLVRYAIGSLGTGGFSTLPGLVLVFYLTDTLGVVAWAAGLVITVAKVWDVLVDPVIGDLSDASRRRTGSRRRIMTIGAIALPVFFLLTFAVPKGTPPLAAGLWVVLAFVLASTSFSLFQVPYIALPAELTGAYDQRTRLLTSRVAVLSLAILLFGAGGPLLRGIGDRYTGYAIMALVAGIAIATGMLVATTIAPRAASGARTPDARDARDASGASASSARWRPHPIAGYRLAIAALRRSAAFRPLLGAFVLQAIATGLMLAGANYVAVWVMHSDDALTFLFVALIAPAILCSPLWSAIARRIGKERGFAWATVLFSVAALALTAAVVAPGPWMYLPVALAGAGYAGMQALPMAMLPDVISHDARTHGSEGAGVFGGVWTAGETLGFALGAGVLTLILTVAGYVQSVAGETVHQPASAVAGIALAFSVVPAVICLLSLVVISRYRLRRADIDAPTATSQDGAPA